MIGEQVLGKYFDILEGVVQFKISVVVPNGDSGVLMQKDFK